MDADTIKAAAELIKAIAWAGGTILALLILRRFLSTLFKHGNPFIVKVGEILAIEVQPSSKSRPPDSSLEALSLLTHAGAEAAPSFNHPHPANDDPDLPPIGTHDPIPSDYLYVVHTSFLRPEKQAEFQRRTGVPLPHFDIQIKVESYYKGALERVSYVEYILHKAFPKPYQSRFDRSDGFLLKELANGEFVLAVKVFLRDKTEPLVLQRYITLWPSGPRI
jgi:hypothetical protein